MTLGSALRQRVQVAVARASGPEAGRRVAEAARAGVAELVRSGPASATYRVFVDGQEGADEASVRVPGGTISYLFSRIGQAAAFGLAYAVQRSPERSGAYKKSWFVAVDGRPWTGPLDAIPQGSEVVISNMAPYSRKIDAGGQRVSVPPGIVEDVRQAVRRRFPGLQVDRSFLVWPGGYVLKSNGRSRRRDRQAGQALTYPSVVISEQVR